MANSKNTNTAGNPLRRENILCRTKSDLLGIRMTDIVPPILPNSFRKTAKFTLIREVWSKSSNLTNVVISWREKKLFRVLFPSFLEVPVKEKKLTLSYY